MKLTHRNSIQILIILASSFVNAQFLSASDTSESTVKRYKNIIRANKDIVAFIEYSLVEKGLPRHLRNLALIESNFNTNATSGAGAVGVWQFMTAHANQYGLTEQNRNDLYRSTKTAAISLSQLYKKYNNWVTVVAAYNCGEGNISKAMAAAGSSQYHVFSKYLPAETINHVKKYLNACYATGELQSVLSNYNSSRINTIFFVNGGSGKNNIEMAETDINAGFNLNVIADELDIEVEKILGWNPGISEELEQKGESILHLPKDLMPDFLLRKNKILSRSLKENSTQIITPQE
ncbi:lytic transglycosylase domain-containing protein [Chryseobacterium sp. SSA4.19]|uniref:lytic transglycosylase domain-containing protein n=1 Tax=Chryseobacterium sp. SSA4.19 TaxID=2919915 RepID=UPI001F4DE60E|nr:lytic transglycosylase domain-containing protein [Chryseobacterium sp. SSA4.19]MCJ8155462.1 lytic transglycosylase domain-containing protein [Chryseobacterium sp. SSA4.19]